MFPFSVVSAEVMVVEKGVVSIAGSISLLQEERQHFLRERMT